MENTKDLKMPPQPTTCSDERPCISCYTDDGPCLAPTPAEVPMPEPDAMLLDDMWGGDDMMGASG